MALGKHTIRSNLACYYRFDSTYGASLTEDDTSNANDLTNNGTSGGVSSGTGKVREAAIFDRSDSQYFNVASSASLQGIQSVCCWVLLSSKPTGGVMGIAAKGVSSADIDNSFQLYWQDSNDRFVFTVSDGVSSDSVDSGSFSIPTDTWIHIACVADFSTKELRMYINGVLQSTAALTISSILIETGDLLIGRRYGGDYWDGQIDEFMAWTESVPVAFFFQHYNGGDGVPFPYMDADIGPKGSSGFYPRMTTASFVESEDGTLFVYTGWKWPIQWDAIREESVKAGVPAPTEQLAFSGSGRGGIAGWYYAYQRWVDENGNVSNLSPISDLTEVYGDIIPIANVRNESPIVVETKTPHGLSDGDKVKIAGVYGTTSANGYWTVKVLSDTEFSLNLSVGNGDFIDNAQDVILSVTTTQEGSSGQNEKQKVQIDGNPTGGNFTLTFNGQTTGPIAYDASAAGLQSALEALSNIAPGDVSVTQGSNNWLVEFTGNYAQSDVPMMTADSSGLIGGTATVSVSTLQEGRAAGTQNEIQKLTFAGPPTGGTFTLTFSGQTTAPIAYNATNATVKAALEALSNIAAGDITVTGGPLPSSPVEIEFGGSLAGTDVATLTCDPSGLTTPVGASVTTEQEGRQPSVNTGQVTKPDLAYQFSAEERANPISAYNSIDRSVGKLSAYEVDVYYGYTARSKLSAGNDPIRRMEILDGQKNSYGIRRFAKYYTQNDPPISGAFFDTTYENRVQYYDTLGYPANTTIFSVSFWFKPIGLETDASDSSELPSLLYDKEFLYSGLFTLMSIFKMFDQVHHMGLLAISAHARYRKNGTTYKPDSLGFIVEGADAPFKTNLAIGANFHLNDWNHVVFVVDGRNVEHQINGLYVELPHTTWSFRPASQFAVAIGPPGNAGNANRYFGANRVVAIPSFCAIDEVYVWLGHKLSEEEAANLYNNGTGLFYPFTPVVDPGANEIQKITLTGNPQFGSFVVTFEGERATISYDASADGLQRALQDMSSIGYGNVTVTKSGSVFTIEFVGSLSKTNVPQITVDDVNLKYSVEVTQEALPARNEKQRVTVGSGAVGGTFTLEFNGATTSAINYDATAAQVQSALEALSTIGAGNVTCTGGPLATNPVDVEFIGALANSDQPQMTVASSSIRAGTVTVSEYQAANAGLNEKQTISMEGTPTGGYWTISFGGQTTSRLFATSSAATVQNALEALSSIGAGNVIVTGGPLDSADLVVEFTGALGNTDVETMTVNNKLISGPAVFVGADTITYTNVEVPTDRRVVRRQILRNKDGDASVFYIDIDTTDLTSTTLTSTNTDDDLTVAVPLFDDQGNDLAITRYSPPVPFHKVATYYRGRVFTAGNFVENRGLADMESSSKNGEGYDIPLVSSYVNRYFYPGDDRNNQAVIDSVDPDAQTFTISDNFAGQTVSGSEFVIHPGEAEDQTIYASEAGLPASFSYLKGLTVSKQPVDGRLTALVVEAGRMFVLFERRLYLYTYTDDPAPPPVGSGRIEPLAWRGCVNHRCWVAAEGNLYFLDEQGIWSYTGTNAVPVSDPIRQIFTGEASPHVNWALREYFHAIHEPGRNILRWFVCLDGWRYPQHALCYDLRLKRWWIEEYPFPVTSSCAGEILGRPYVLLGSTNRRVFVLRDQPLDVAKEGWPVTLRGTVTSASLLSLSDSSATFDSRLVGCPVEIASGTGSGQRRTIVSVSSTKLLVDRPWIIQPDSTSVYQIGGIRWTYRTGTFYLQPDRAGEGGSFRIYFRPESERSLLSFRRKLGIQGSDIDSEVTRTYEQGDGVKSTEDSAQLEIDTTLSQGYILQSFSEFVGFQLRSEDRIALELTGVPNKKRQEILGINVDGAFQ